MLSATFLSYYLFVSGRLGLLASYLLFPSITFMESTLSFSEKSSIESTSSVEPCIEDRVENLGGSGPKVAAYVRVSTRQSVSYLP